jgi:hypothetical protein
MLKCIESFLDDPLSGRRIIRLDENPPQMVESADILRKLIDAKFPQNHMIWFHVDDHLKMCEQGVAEYGGTPGSHFMRGALRLLTHVPDSHVIATDTERPSMPTMGSPTEVRYPMALPPPDLYQIAAEIPELNMIKTWSDDAALSSDERRLLITLMYRLYVKIREDLVYYLHRRRVDPDIEAFLSRFQAAATNHEASVETRLMNSINLCAVDVPSAADAHDDSFASSILCGFTDDDRTEVSRHVSNVVVSPDKGLSYSLDHLLTLTDPTNKIFDVGRRLFRSAIADNMQADYLRSGPLRAAYYWSLSCQAAIFKINHYALGSSFKIDCKQLLPGRLFPKDRDDDYDVSKLLPKTIYYADERNGQPPHPLCDMFFVTKPYDNKRELVLVDIIEGRADVVLDKVIQLNSWIAREQKKKKNSKLQLNAVIIAPFAKGESYTNTTAVVTGDDAIGLLGGLSQIQIFEQFKS